MTHDASKIFVKTLFLTNQVITNLKHAGTINKGFPPYLSPIIDVISAQFLNLRNDIIISWLHAFTIIC